MVQDLTTSSTALAQTFNNARTSLTASQSEEIIPASSASHSGIYVADTVIGATDVIQLSANSGTNYTSLDNGQLEGAIVNSAGDTWNIVGVGNSTGRYKYVASASVGTRIFQRCITIVS